MWFGAHRDSMVKTKSSPIVSVISTKVWKGRSMDADERLAAVESLLRAVGSPDPLGAVVRQLNAYVDGGAIILDHSGNPVREAGRAPVHLLAASLENGIAEGQLQLGRWRAGSTSAVLLGSPGALGLRGLCSRGVCARHGERRTGLAGGAG